MSLLVTTWTPFGGKSVDQYNSVNSMYVEDGCLWIEYLKTDHNVHVLSIPVEIVKKVEVCIYD